MTYIPFQTDSTKPCVVLLGKTGVGKTTLAQRILGNNIVPDTAISHSHPMTKSFILYRGCYIDIWDSRGYDINESITIFKDNIISLLKYLHNNRDLRIPAVVWYCISGTDSRVTSFDIEAISQIPISLFIVVTKFESMSQIQVNEIYFLLSQIVNPLVYIKYKEYHETCHFVSSDRNIGIDQLLNKNRELYPYAERLLIEKMDAFLIDYTDC